MPVSSKATPLFSACTWARMLWRTHSGGAVASRGAWRCSSARRRARPSRAGKQFRSAHLVIKVTKQGHSASFTDHFSRAITRQAGSSLSRCPPSSQEHLSAAGTGPRLGNRIPLQGRQCLPGAQVKVSSGLPPVEPVSGDAMRPPSGVVRGLEPALPACDAAEGLDATAHPARRMLVTLYPVLGGQPIPPFAL